MSSTPPPDNPGPRTPAFHEGFPSHPPPRVPDYLLDEWRGRGSWGTVFKARRVSDNKFVAIKLIPRLGIGQAADGAELPARDREEMELRARRRYEAELRAYRR